MEDEKKNPEEVKEKKPEKEETKEKQESDKSEGKESLTDKIRENPWIVATLVLGILALIILLGNFIGFTGGSITTFPGSITGGTVGVSDIGNMILEIVNSQGGDAELIDVSKEHGLYKVTFSSGGQESSVYVTLDGENIVNGLIPLSVLLQQDESSQQTPQLYSEEDNQKIQEFSQCLADNGMRVYYAGWCGHCHNLIETFGGLENAGEMMIECQTENQQPGEGADLCDEEEITGYPTIKINGKAYSGGRTFEAFAEATGCVAPDLS